MSSIADLPIEVLLDNVLSFMQISDILRLGSTNQFFAAVCSDDTFWRRRLQSDFNFSGAGTARTSGWKFIYRGLFNPRVYVWGEKSHGRLGLSKYPKSIMRAVPFPVQLHIPGVRIVSLIAGGMSFHALDSKGQIYVWGTLDGTAPGLKSDGFSEAGTKANSPLRLRMPAATRSISCGRLHASSLDSKGQIWTFLTWGRPFRLVSDLFTDPDSKPLQIECGWAFSCVLTQSGDVFVWWPFSGEMAVHIERVNTEMDDQGDKKASALPDKTIPCVTWDLNEDPVRLPSIPPLPELTEESEEKPTQLIQIAGLDGHIIGLTNKGHVLKFGSLDSKATFTRGNWQYLPAFSEVEKVQTEYYRFSLDPPQTMKITHISANFLHFIAYSTGSSSVVLIGDTETDSQSQPKVIPALQNKSIISVVLGDYHSVALTSDGKVLTWGAYSAGALGLGDPFKLTPGSPGAFETEARRLSALQHSWGEPPSVEVPTEVRFDHGRKTRKDRFCFSIAAAGWHTGALVIDLEPDADEDEDDNIELEPEDPPLPSRIIRQHPNPGPPIIPFPGFRIGFAGRPRGG
ncbi:hypothetical protein D9615_006986 [Tricholomella constricta]|uniref:F-box domain-containing protein n=1 Tax=Tricholomella constricta TaxID=117010 RepID=A0A8H5H8X9_9AGAR|nr:hypothetical protein D9615_006986 [Tricholomella constricta]